MSLPELQQNPLVQRVIDIFDADGNGEVDFKGNFHHFPDRFDHVSRITSVLVTANRDLRQSEHVLILSSN